MYSLESYALKFDFKFRDLKYECVEVIKGKFSGELSLDNENLSVNSVRIDGNEAKFSIADKRLILGPVEGAEAVETTSSFEDVGMALPLVVIAALGSVMSFRE